MTRRSWRNTPSKSRPAELFVLSDNFYVGERLADSVALVVWLIQVTVALLFFAAFRLVADGFGARGTGLAGVCYRTPC